MQDNVSFNYDNLDFLEKSEDNSTFELFSFLSKYKKKLAFLTTIGFLSFGAGFLIGRYNPNHNLQSNSIVENNAMNNGVKKDPDKLLYNLLFDDKSIEDFLFKKNKHFQKNKREKLEDYLEKFSNVDFDSKWKKKHAMKIYDIHQEFLDKTCDLYDVPVEFFLAKLGLEGANMASVSPTGAMGYSQLFNSAVIESFYYVLNNDIDEGILYTYAKEYKSTNLLTKKKEIIDEVKTNPISNLEAGVAYSSLLKNRFVDWSLVSAAYQMGPSKLAKMIHYHKGIETGNWWPRIYIYEKNEYNNQMEVAVDYSVLKEYVLENDLNIYDLLNNDSLMRYYNSDFKRLYDRFETYPFEVLKTTYDIFHDDIS